MSRSIVLSLAVLALLQAAVATIDLSTTKNIELLFTDEDVIPKSMLTSLGSKAYAESFIGNIEIGGHRSDEIILRRVVVFENPTHEIQSSSLAITVPRDGIVHYLLVENKPDSYAVVCDHSNSLGSSKSVITLRAGPRTKSVLNLTIAAH